jgi:aminotransferase
MRPKTSRRIEGLVQSPIRAMTRACLRANGINLGQGVCHMPAPDAVREGAVAAIRAGESLYSKYEGVDELRAAIAAKVTSFNRIPCDPDREVVVTVGSSGAFAAAALALADPGDEAIVFEPYYGYHVNLLLVAGVVPSLVTLRPPEWRLDPAALAAAVTDRTRLVVVNTPANPSGKVFTRADLETVARVCRDRDLIAVTDEVYEHILFDGREHVSLATMPGMRERTVTITSLSKTFAITGWRIGYAVAPEPLAQAIGLVADLLHICAPTPLQHGVAHALRTLGRDYYDGLSRAYQSKRDRLCDALAAARLTPHVPEGAYYVLAQTSPLGERDDQAAADRLLEKTGVASVPGRAFYRGEAGRSLLRICFALEDTLLDEACRRLRESSFQSTGRFVR